MKKSSTTTVVRHVMYSTHRPRDYVSFQQEMDQLDRMIAQKRHALKKQELKKQEWPTTPSGSRGKEALDVVRVRITNDLLEVLPHPDMFAVHILTALVDTLPDTERRVYIVRLAESKSISHLRLATCVVTTSTRTCDAVQLKEMIVRLFEHAEDDIVAAVLRKQRFWVLDFSPFMERILRHGRIDRDYHELFMVRFHLSCGIGYEALHAMETTWIDALEHYRIYYEHQRRWEETGESGDDDDCPEEPTWTYTHCLLGLAALAWYEEPGSALRRELFDWYFDLVTVDLDGYIAHRLFLLTVIHNHPDHSEFKDPHTVFEGQIIYGYMKEIDETKIILEAMLRSRSHDLSESDDQSAMEESLLHLAHQQKDPVARKLAIKVCRKLVIEM